MSEFNIFYLIKAKKRLITLVAVLFVVIGMGVSLIQPLRYTASLRLLVVEKAGPTADPYAMSKATDYLSQLLAKVAYSNLFFNHALATDPSIDSAYFGVTDKSRAKQWQRTIDVKSVKDTGIITISAYQPSRDQATRIARATALTLMTQHANYHGLGNNVVVRLLDEPVTSTYPDQPNLLINFIASLVAGLAFGLAWAYLQPNKNVEQLPSVAPDSDYQIIDEDDNENLTASDPEQLGARFPWQN